MKKTKAAVIGCGRIAGHHCRNIRQNEALELTAVCDLETQKAQAYAKEFAVPAYSSYREMLEKHPEIELVAVITPSGMHYEHAKEILTIFHKHLVVEKPTFLRLRHLEEIYSLAQERKLQIFPVFQNRYNLAVQRVKQALDSGELGEARLISVRVRWCRPQRYYDLSPWRGTFSMDGGALTNQGVHHIDLLRFLGGEVEEVQALMTTLGAEIEVEDTCVATMKFASGALGSLEITTAARPDDFEASISIVGSKGLAQIGGIAVNELQLFTPDPAEIKKYSEDFSACVYGNGHRVLYDGIANFFTRRGASNLVNEKDCLSTLQLLHAFYVSSEQKIPVRPAGGLESARLGEPDEELAKLYRIQGEKA